LFENQRDAKRLIGRRFSDPSVQTDIQVQLWPFKVIDRPGDKQVIVVNYKGQEKQFAAEEISSMVLTKMKEIAEPYLGYTIKNAVVSHSPCILQRLSTAGNKRCWCHCWPQRNVYY
jgi:molecular chaperone DnaK (HSP70)